MLGREPASVFPPPGTIDDAAEVTVEPTCVLTREREVRCWGPPVCDTVNGRDNPDLTGEPDPELPGSIAIGVGARLGCVLDKAGTVRCWGHEEPLGPCLVPDVHRVAGLAPVVQISVARDAACALEEDGTVKCWGEARSDMLGLPKPGDEVVLAPRIIPLGGPAVKVSTHSDAGVALLANGHVWFWGRHLFTGDDLQPPRRAVDIEAGVEIIASDLFGCALLPDRNLRCFGPKYAKEQEAGAPAIRTQGGLGQAVAG